MSLVLTRRHNVDRFGYLIPTRYGNVPMVGAVATYRPSEGRFGGAVAVEEETENRVPPSRIKFVGWNTYQGSERTLIQDQAFPEIGRADATRIQVSGGTNVLKYYTTIETSIDGQDYTGSVYIKNVGEYPVRFRTQIGPTIDVNPGEWRRVVTSDVGNDHTSFQLRFEALDPGDALDFIAWGPQVEYKPFATSFVNGPREKGRLVYPMKILDSSKGTISSWVYINTSVISTLIGNGRYFFWGNINTNEAGLIGLYWYPVNQVVRYRISQDDGVFSSVDIPLPSTGWHLFTTTWGEGVMSLYVDGQLAGSNVVDLPASFAGSGLFVGGGIGLGPLNTLFDGFLVLPYEASAAEIQDWYESHGPLPPHPQATLQWDWQAVRPAQMVTL